MRGMHLPNGISIPSNGKEAIGIYRARLRSGLQVPRELSQLLMAYMAWPNDKTSRNLWMASANARSFTLQEDFSSPASIAKFGGFESVAKESLDGISGRLHSELGRWPPAADVMQMVVDLHYSGLPIAGGSSISKAIALCADEKLGLSEGQMRREWIRFRDVAHLLAAGAALATEVPESEGSIFSAAWFAPESLLAVSAGFLRFGLDFKPHGQQKPLLPIGSAWRLPSHCMPDNPWLQHRKLSNRQEQVLSDYAAKKAYVRKS